MQAICAIGKLEHNAPPTDANQFRMSTLHLSILRNELHDEVWHWRLDRPDSIFVQFAGCHLGQTKPARRELGTG